MNHLLSNNPNATPLIPLTPQSLEAWLHAATPAQRAWVTAHGFTAKPETCIAIADDDGSLACALVGVAEPINIWSLAHAPALLPAGDYRIETGDTALEDMALGILLAQYQFDRYKANEKKPFTLSLPETINSEALLQKAEAIALVRDLINTPTNDMGPEELAAAARAVAEKMGASFTQIVGDDLLAQNYPAIHAVGRASPNAPRLIDMRHGKASDPLITLVGKGVCFDTGGLDVKPLSSMKLMKKDMGGAALMLGLFQRIVQLGLPVRVRLLIAAVENSISGNAFRPQDIIPTRKGLSVEIISTDAEGRVILCDALTEAASESPEIIIDAATLTGAARTALGAELPALFCNDDATAHALQETAMRVHDPMWRLPLWKGYDKYITSSVADITNSPNYAMAGAITAALYLQRFIPKNQNWIHLDSYAWNAESLPGRPFGGEALCLRALEAFLQTRYA